MSLKGIMSITGMSGLYKLVAQTKSGFVVESLTDQKRYPISASQKISMLDDISVFTKAGDIPLKEILIKMKENDALASSTDPKGSPESLKKFFKAVVPDFDEEKVYVSDIKKMVIWYHLVKDLLNKEEEKDENSGSADIPELAGSAATREHHAHPVADHQKIKASDKKVTSTKTRKKV